MEQSSCLVCRLFQDAIGQQLGQFLAELTHAMLRICATCGQPWSEHLMAHPHENARRAEPCSGVT